MNSDSEKKMDRVMRLSEVAEVFGLCTRSVRRMSDRGELPPLVHNGRTVGLFKSDVEARLEQMREQRGICPERNKI